MSQNQNQSNYLANRNRCKQHNEPIRIQASTSNWRQAQENACDENTIGSGLDSLWLKKWREFC